MKKNVAYIGMAAMATILSVACNKAEIESQVPSEGQTITMTVSASTPTSKVTIGGKDNGKYPVSWDATGESVYLGESLLNGSTYTTGNTTSSSGYSLVDGKAHFTFSLEQKTADGYDYYFISPASACKGYYADYKDFTLVIPSTQTPKVSSVDPSAAIMFAQGTTEDNTTQGGSISADFSTIVAYGKLSVTALPTALPSGTKIESITIATSSTSISGTIWYYYDGAISVREGENSITIKTDNITTTSTPFDVWFACLPFSLSANDNLYFTLTTDTGIYKKTSTVKNARSFTANNVSEFKVDLSNAELEIDPDAVYTIATIADKKTWENGKAYNIDTDDNNNADLSLTYGGGGNNGKYYSSDETWRFYKGGSMTVSATDCNIKKIVITLNEGSFTAEGYSDGTWTGDAKSVIFAATKTSKITKIKVWYTAEPCQTPTIEFNSPTVTITSETSGSTIYYTLDGTDPTSTSTKYEGPFSIDKTTTIKAIATKEGRDDSEIAEKECEYSKLATITCIESLDINKAGGNGEITVTYTDAESYELKIYTDSECKTEASGSWLSAEFDESHNIDWSATANSGVERKVYIKISVTNSTKSITEKVITVTQSGVLTLWCETWNGGTVGKKPSEYGQEGTTVYNDGEVTYTESGSSTKLYSDTFDTINLLLAKKSNSGVWNILGIPTANKTSLTLSFITNSNATDRYKVSSSTDGVSIGEYTVTGTKSPYTVTATITVENTVESFNLTFTNNLSSNVRLDDIMVLGD